MQTCLHCARKGLLPTLSSRTDALPLLIHPRRQPQAQLVLLNSLTQPLRCIDNLTRQKHQHHHHHQQQQQQRGLYPLQAAAQEADIFDELQHSDYPTRVYLESSELPHELIGPIAVRDLPGKGLCSKQAVQGLGFRRTPWTLQGQAGQSTNRRLHI